MSVYDSISCDSKIVKHVSGVDNVSTTDREGYDPMNTACTVCIVCKLYRSKGRMTIHTLE